MEQSIQELNKQNLLKIAFKEFEGVWSALFLNTLSHMLKVV